MNKSTFFSGQPIFTQLLKFISRDEVHSIAQRNQSDRYCKRFSTYDHLVTLLYSIFNNRNSLREIATGILSWLGGLPLKTTKRPLVPDPVLKDGVKVPGYLGSGLASDIELS